MDEKKGRSCPECGCDRYLFRGRKMIPAENGHAEAMDTKYRCRACAHVWTERVPVNAEKQ
jgi:rubredoxin